MASPISLRPCPTFTNHRPARPSIYSLPSISLMIQPCPSTMMRLPSWLAASAREDEAWIQTCSLPAWSKSVGSSGTLEKVWGNVAIQTLYLLGRTVGTMTKRCHVLIHALLYEQGEHSRWQ